MMDQPLPHLIGFAGKKRHGKNTAADLLPTPAWQQLAFADPIKKALDAMGFPEPVDKEKHIPEVGCSWRYLAQTLGTQWGRQTVSPNIWVNATRHRIESLFAHDYRVAVTDVRFPNEVDMIRELGGVVVLVQRPDAPDYADSHISENHVITPDYVVVNSGPPEGMLAQMRSLGIVA